MTDERFVFNQDIRDKKSAAHGAIHRRNGSRSKRCSLPSDNLTPAQLKRRNGPMSTYNISTRLTWKEFKALPQDLQATYLVNLSNAYHVSRKRIAEMLDINTVTLGRRIDELTYNGYACPAFSKGGDFQSAMHKVNTSLWQEFLDGKRTASGTKVMPEDEPATEIPSPLVVPASHPELTATETPELTYPTGMLFHFSGTLDELYGYLSYATKGGQKYHFTINMFE